MLTISKKLHIEQFLSSFTQFANFDSPQNKYYFVFEDRDRGGQMTLMNTFGVWSIHGKGENYSDLNETLLKEEEVITLVWKHRGAVNRAIKSIQDHKELVLK
ncbi:hypothetical protein [Bacillus alkalicellulosilyticus]|uniref:hypothetical protein n=1 Tax=Alkalihalobacterium alkalicellulosilyticum TaxID=1912214 RepID=UPI000998AFEB|nr:hypothetical protein [Bacillus alkalicellulosilyticus]